MVERAEHVDAAAADAVAKGEEVVERVDVERDVLHRAGGRRAGAAAGVGDAELARDVGDRRHLHEGDVARVVELDEAVLGAGDAVHPVQRLELGAEDVGEERQLRLHVRRRDRQVVDTAGQAHEIPRSSGRGGEGSAGQPPTASATARHSSSDGWPARDTTLMAT